MSCKEKIRKENFQICLSLSFHYNKIEIKVRISSPLQTYLVDVSNRKETYPRRPQIQFEKEKNNEKSVGE